MHQFDEYSNTDSVLNFRNKTTIFTGTLLLLLTLYIGFFSGPIPNDPSEVSTFLFIYLLVSILLFIPLGYFIPVIFLKVKKARHVALATLPLGVLWGIYLSIIVIWYLPISLCISIFLASLFGSILGTMLGYGILIIISRGSLILTNSFHKKR